MCIRCVRFLQSNWGHKLLWALEASGAGDGDEEMLSETLGWYMAAVHANGHRRLAHRDGAVL